MGAFSTFPLYESFRGDSGKVERSGKANDGPTNPSKAPEGFGNVWMEVFASFYTKLLMHSCGSLLESPSSLINV